MATRVLEQVKFLYNEAGDAPEYQDCTLTSGYTGVAGSLVIITNNEVAVCGSDPAQIFGLATGSYLQIVPGKVNPNDSNLAMQSIMKIRPNDVFQMQPVGSSAALSVFADAALDFQGTASLFGVAINTVSGVTAWTVDLTETTVLRVQVIKRRFEDTGTDLYPRLEVKFLVKELYAG